MIEEVVVWLPALVTAEPVGGNSLIIYGLAVVLSASLLYLWILALVGCDKGGGEPEGAVRGSGWAAAGIDGAERVLGGD